VVASPPSARSCFSRFGQRAGESHRHKNLGEFVIPRDRILQLGRGLAHAQSWTFLNGDPQRARESRVLVGALLDLAGMKMRVIQMRGSWKDYVGIHALVSHGIDLATALGASAP